MGAGDVADFLAEKSMAPQRPEFHAAADVYQFLAVLGLSCLVLVPDVHAHYCAAVGG